MHPHWQMIFTKCFCWFLPTSSISIWPKISTDKWMELQQADWLMILLMLQSKMEVKQWRRVFISGMSDFFAELDSSVWLPQEYFLDFCAICNLTTIYVMHLIIDIFSITFLSWDNQQNNRWSSELKCLPMSVVQIHLHLQIDLFYATNAMYLNGDLGRDVWLYGLPTV